MEIWEKSEKALKTSLEFKDFKTAWAFMDEVATLAEAVQHHPNWSNVYNSVSITLSTHDADNTVTAKDEELAKQIEQVLENYEFQVTGS